MCQSSKVWMPCFHVKSLYDSVMKTKKKTCTRDYLTQEDLEHVDLEGLQKKPL